jgi:dephospho-CoA kinase
LIIAITGNVGSGKSMVASYLAEISGAMHCDTDRVCRDLLEKDKPGWIEVKKVWGNHFLNNDGSIDRKRLRTAVFEDTTTRRELENILHPLVQDYVIDLIDSCRNSQTLLIVEVPLLFEVGWQHRFDFVVTVIAEQRDVVERVVLRDTVSPSHVEKILNSQMDLADKAQCSDFVIDNSGSIENTYAQVDLLKEQIISKQGNY